MNIEGSKMTLKIKFLREKAGLKQHELASKLGIGQSTVAMWESGKANPTVDKLPELARILGCAISDLFSDITKA